MATVEVKSAAGSVTGSVELPAEVFDVQVNIPLVHQVVVAQLAAARQGTASTKTRGEVRGGGRKPYRQKGTGRARQGSTRAPQFAGGGTVHGPTPRSYAQRTPKKMKAAALRSALSDRARGGKLHVVESLVEGSVPSTKAAQVALATIAQSRHVLVVVERADVVTWKSLRNVAPVHVIAPDQLNTYDVLVSDDLVFTEGALRVFLGGEASEARPVVPGEVKPKAKPVKAAAKASTKAAAKKKAAAEAETADEPVEETVADAVVEAPADEVAADETATDEAPVDETPADEAAADEATVETATDEVAE
jgi:large subunit ribosomal protein L4